MTNSKKWYLLLSATGLTFNFLAKGHRQKSSIGYVRVHHRGGIMALVTKGEKIIRDRHEELHKCLMQTESRLRATGLCVVSERAVTWAAGHVESGPSVIQPAHEPSLCPRGLPPSSGLRVRAAASEGLPPAAAPASARCSPPVCVRHRTHTTHHGLALVHSVSSLWNVRSEGGYHAGLAS